jgi:secreted Zn-dependent insulinase-like peptidase
VFPTLTLHQVIRDHLVRFHQAHYVAANMRLAVLGSAPIHVMASWITSYFSDVPVSYPGTAPAAPLPSSPADSVAANFDRDWFKMCACAMSHPTCSAPIRFSDRLDSNATCHYTP